MIILKKSNSLLLVLGTILPLFTLNASEISNTSAQEVNYPKYSGSVSVDLNSNLEKDKNKKSITSTVELINSLKLENDYKINLYLSAIKDYQSEQKTELQNGYLGVVKKVLSIDETDLAHTLSLEARAYLPLNQQAANDDSFRTRAYLAPILNLNGESIGINNLSISLKSAYSRNFYQYNENKEGTANTKNTWSNSASLNYNFSDKFSISAYYLHQTSHNFKNRRLPDRYEIGESLDYSITKNFSLEIGHIIGGTTYKYNGVDNNINLFNKNDSTIYSACTFSF